jgi:prophage DNA circulation protein
MSSTPALPGWDNAMGYREDYRPASFRGVSFHVRASDVTVGRRLARHEYPQRDIPYLEDMGRSAREYQVEAFVLGSNYRSIRDALVKAIEQAGPGQLVHPYYGTVMVVVSAGVKVTESTEEGGIARFSIQFVEAGKQEYPNSVTDTGFVLDNQLSNAMNVFASDFAANFSIDGVLDFVSADAMQNVTSLLKLPDLSSVLASVSAFVADPLSPLKALLPQNLMSSLMNPIALATGLVALIGGLAGGKTGGRSGSAASLLDYSLPPVYGSEYTPSRAIEADNRIALNNLVVQAATAVYVTELARSAAQTLDDARAVSADIVASSDRILMDPDTGYQAVAAMMQLRTEAIRHFSAVTADLPRAVQVTNNISLPSIVMANVFYGDKWEQQERDQDIVSRNRIRHPGFLPAGRSLQILTP